MTGVDKQVLIVDDSAVVRQVLKAIINAMPGFSVMATAQDPLFAMRRMKQQWPDVIVLDIEMPRMDGLTFLRKVMAERPTPVVICSTLTEQDSDISVKARAAGAVDIITKPRVGLKAFLEETQQRLQQAIRTAANAQSGVDSTRRPATPRLTADAMLEPTQAAPCYETTQRLIALGVSTGGVQCLEYLLPKLPRTTPGMVIVQHMPGRHTTAFAQRLNKLCELTVKEAVQGDRILPGQVLLAPGGRHLLVERSGAQYQVTIKAGPPVSRHCPSVDVLFRSVARAAGPNAVGIILTGMGSDGAAGLKEMHDSGALTLAQDEASSIVYGMPREAVRAGAVDSSLALSQMPQWLATAPNRQQFFRQAG